MPINQKNKILTYLEAAYGEARIQNNTEMMCRLSRAIVAFSYDNIEIEPNWGKMAEAYALKNEEKVRKVLEKEFGS